MKTIKLIAAALLVCSTAFAASPSSINNDDTCDIKVGPAATLLLPYFEVDISGNTGRTTLFTITNVTRNPQIAHVTLWTDWAYPVLVFNLFLTGYDEQSVNLADVLKSSTVSAPDSGTPNGALSTSSNDNLRLARGCDPVSPFPPSVMNGARNALTIGVYNPGAGINSCPFAGNAHINAIGYATIDVVSNCTSRFPNDPLYYSEDLLFDNVLIGDYQQLAAVPFGSAATRFDAAGNPMVHIRAVPEGGGAGSNVATELPYTFYDRYTPKGSRTRDRRQPLPSTFAARYIQGGLSSFVTNFTIWREGLETGTCVSYYYNQAIDVAEIVRFDEHDNAYVWGLLPCGPPGGCQQVTTSFPAASTGPTADFNHYPYMVGTDVGGWIYIDLNNGGGQGTYSVTRDIGGVPVTTTGPSNLAPPGSLTNGPRPSQNWLTVTMFGSLGSHSLSTEFDAASLGNGCSPASVRTRANLGTGPPLGPAGGVLVCPPGTTLTDGTTTLCTGTNANPNP